LSFSFLIRMEDIIRDGLASYREEAKHFNGRGPNNFFFFFFL